MSLVGKASDGGLVLKVEETLPGGGVTFADILRKDFGLGVDVRNAQDPTAIVPLRELNSFMRPCEIEAELRALLNIPEHRPVRPREPK